MVQKILLVVIKKIKEANITLPGVLLSIILVITIIGALLVTKTLSDIKQSIASTRSANIKITRIITPDCTDCFNVDSVITILKQQNIMVEEDKTISFDSAEAQSLIKQFNIQRVPTYVASGEINKNNVSDFFKNNGHIKNDTFVFTKITPLFIDTQTKNKIGQIFATVLTDPYCSYCLNPKLVIEDFKKADIKVTIQKELQWDSPEGQQFIKKYNITRVPTFLLSADADYYDSLKSVWSQVGTIEQDKTYVARNIFMPYRDLVKNQIAGLVNVVYIVDVTCADCYKPEVVQKNILVKNFGLAISYEKTIDINSEEGKVLKQKYNLSSIPTVLLSPAVDEYVNLKNIWKSVGTVEKDGWYVFRQMNQLGGTIYKDLNSNKIIRPAK